MGKISSKGRQGGRNRGSGFLRADLGSWLGGKDPPRQNLGGRTALRSRGRDRTAGRHLGLAPSPGGEDPLFPSSFFCLVILSKNLWDREPRVSTENPQNSQGQHDVPARGFTSTSKAEGRARLSPREPGSGCRSSLPDAEQLHGNGIWLQEHFNS